MVLYLWFSNGAEVFFFYLFTLAPGSVAVFALADPDVAEVVFPACAASVAAGRGIGNYNNHFAGSDVLINAGRNVPEAEPCDVRLWRALAKARRGVPACRPPRWGLPPRDRRYFFF